MKSKEAYKKIYVDEIDTSIIPESPALEKWTMVDQFILSPEEFDKNYALPAWSWYKDDLIKACNEKNIPIPKWTKVDDIKALLYWNRNVLTAKEVETVTGIKRELKRQPLYDFDGNYEHQKELIVEYKGHKLKWTLDRLSIEKWLIRDLKTSKDVEFSKWKQSTLLEDKLTQNDEYLYGFQLSRYWLLCKINYDKEFSCIIDAVKATGNYAFESYIYRNETIKKIAVSILFPALDELIATIDSGDWSDDEDVRNRLINDRYYPLLDGWIQKEFREIQPAFY